MMLSKTVVPCCRIMTSKCHFRRTNETKSMKKNPLMKMKYIFIYLSLKKCQRWNGRAGRPYSKLVLCFYSSLAAGYCSGQGPGLVII